ncbi:MAG: hypothetical protein UHN02_00565 [Acutalibacteraceae bacterium]|nr:hypothetical protein [Acutalibacteraceae bacterium]
MIKVVVNLNGRDKGKLFAVIKDEGKFVLIANGKQRKIDSAKLKSKKHIKDTGVTLEESWIKTNRSLAKALRTVNQ